MAALTGQARTAETYLAGLGASGALISGAVVVFLVLIGLVIFDAWPRAAGLLEFNDSEEERAVDTRVAADAAASALAPAKDLVASSDAGTPLVTAPQGGRLNGGDGAAQGPVPGQTPRPGADTGGGGTGGGGRGDTPITDTVNNTGQTVNGTVDNVGQIVDTTVTGLSETVKTTLDHTVTTVNSLLGGLTGK